MNYDTINIKLYYSDLKFFEDNYITITTRHLSGYKVISFKKLKKLLSKYSFYSKYIIFDNINDNDIVYYIIRSGNDEIEYFLSNLNIYCRYLFEYLLFDKGSFIKIKSYTDIEIKNNIRRDKLLNISKNTN